MMNRAPDRQTAGLMKLSLLGSIGIGLILLWQQVQASLAVAGVVLAAGIALVASRYRSLRRKRLGVPCNAVDRRKLSSVRLSQSCSRIQQCLRGHDETVRIVCRMIDANLMLEDGGRCLGKFMLVGPTGTGKTYLSELIAAALYPASEIVVIRMNQYKDTSDVQALLGSVETSEPGQLTQAVMENPYRVILLDEIEKAHPDVIHSLYDILDSGCTRDKVTGNLISFEACVFLATCNQGADELRALQGASDAAWIGKARDALSGSAGFDRAFLARWDQIFLMDQLSMSHIAEVAMLGISRFWREHGMDVAFASPKLVLELVRANREFGQYGVRQLQQLIRSRSDHAVLESRKAGQQKVILDLGSNGDMQVRREAS